MLKSQEYLNGREAAKNDLYRRRKFPPYRTQDFVQGYSDYWEGVNVPD